MTALLDSELAVARVCDTIGNAEQVDLDRLAATVGVSPAEASRILRHRLGWRLTSVTHRHGEMVRLYEPARRRAD